MAASFTELQAPPSGLRLYRTNGAGVLAAPVDGRPSSDARWTARLPPEKSPRQGGAGQGGRRPLAPWWAHRTYPRRPASNGRPVKRWGPHVPVRMVTVRAHPREQPLGARNECGSLLVSLCETTYRCEMCSSLRNKTDGPGRSSYKPSFAQRNLPALLTLG